MLSRPGGTSPGSRAGVCARARQAARLARADAEETQRRCGDEEEASGLRRRLSHYTNTNTNYYFV
eukprot:5970485-Prymnesium_polylepis.1